MTQILGFAGKKQSGKNTACNYIVALKIAELGISKSTRLSERGEIEVTDIFGEKKDEEQKEAKINFYYHGKLQCWLEDLYHGAPLRIEVARGVWNHGHVIGYNKERQRHKIVFGKSEGDVSRWLDLSVYKFELVAAEPYCFRVALDEDTVSAAPRSSLVMRSRGPLHNSVPYATMERKSREMALTLLNK